MFRQIFRGLGRMPHVGPHPGLPLLGLLTFIGIATGAPERGLAGGLVGGLCMLLPFGFFVCIGAYDRAQLSDRLSESCGNVLLNQHRHQDTR